MFGKKYRDPELHAAYKRGKREAQEIWGDFFHCPERVSGVIQNFRDGLDQYKRFLKGSSGSVAYRREIEQRIAHHTGWLDAWKRR